MFLWLTNFRQNVDIESAKTWGRSLRFILLVKNGRVGRNLSEPCHSAFTGNANPKCRFECSRVTAPTAAKCPEIRRSALKNRNDCWENKIGDYQDSLFSKYVWFPFLVDSIPKRIILMQRQLADPRLDLAGLERVFRVAFSFEPRRWWRRPFILAHLLVSATVKSTLMIGRISCSVLGICWSRNEIVVSSWKHLIRSHFILCGHQRVLVVKSGRE